MLRGNLIAVVHAVQASGPASICCSVMKFDPTGKLISTFLPAMNPPISLALDPAGDIYLAGSIVTTKGNLTGTPISNSIVTKISPAGATLYSFTFGGSQDDTPYAIAIDSSGDAYIAGEHAVSRFSRHSRRRADQIRRRRERARLRRLRRRVSG